MVKFYVVYDRLSTRHDWQIYGRDAGKNNCHILMGNCAWAYNRWSVKNKFPKYQIAYKVVEVEWIQDIPQSLPSNTTMDKVYNVVDIMNRVKPLTIYDIDKEFLVA